MKKIIQNTEGTDAPPPLSAQIKHGVVYSLTIAEAAKEIERPVITPDGEDSTESVRVWTWTETVFEQIEIRSYSALVSFLVRARYSADDVEAALANAADGNPTDIDAINAWRAVVKPFARSVFSA